MERRRVDLEQREKWIRALNRVWDIVGSDCLTDDYGKPDESMIMSRDEVFEIAGDRHIWQADS